MNRVTPNSAPDEIPVVYESATGFLTIVCMTDPPTPRMAPTRIPPMAIGTYPSHTRKLLRRSSYVPNSMPQILSHTIPRDSTKPRSYFETEME